jgi:hypothetical protein
MQWSRHYWNESTSRNPLWCGWQRCCCIVFNLFYGCKMMTSEPNIESLEEPEVPENKIWRIQWLKFGSTRTTVDLCTGCDKADYHGAASHFLFLLFWSSKPICIRYQFHLLYLQIITDWADVTTVELWPHLLFTTFNPFPPPPCTNGRSRIYSATE